MTAMLYGIAWLCQRITGYALYPAFTTNASGNMYPYTGYTLSASCLYHRSQERSSTGAVIAFQHYFLFYRNHYNMKRVFALLGLCLFIYPCFAQITTITGVIQEYNTGLFLPGVTVQEKGTSNGITSNDNGAFTLAVSQPNATLIFTSVGYETQEIRLNGRSSLTILLLPGNNVLNDVVVTALGIQRNKKELGYAIRPFVPKTLPK
jgi:hypothetical protein